jgi:hypothetical protein
MLSVYNKVIIIFAATKLFSNANHTEKEKESLHSRNRCFAADSVMLISSNSRQYLGHCKSTTKKLMFALRQQSSNTNHRKGKLTSLSLPACAGS